MFKSGYVYLDSWLCSAIFISCLSQYRSFILCHGVWYSAIVYKHVYILARECDDLTAVLVEANGLVMYYVQ